MSDRVGLLGQRDQRSQVVRRETELAAIPYEGQTPDILLAIGAAAGAARAASGIRPHKTGSC